MESKTILITGSTDGIGKITAKALANQGHTVIVHGRNKTKTETVCEEIKSETGNNKIDFVIADLLLLSDVKRMADEFRKKYERLDVLINNAGAIFGKDREITKEGFENDDSKFIFTISFNPIVVRKFSKKPYCTNYQRFLGSTYYE